MQVFKIGCVLAAGAQAINLNLAAANVEAATAAQGQVREFQA